MVRDTEASRLLGGLDAGLGAVDVLDLRAGGRAARAAARVTEQRRGPSRLSRARPAAPTRNEKEKSLRIYEKIPSWTH